MVRRILADGRRIVKQPKHRGRRPELVMLTLAPAAQAGRSPRFGKLAGGLRLRSTHPHSLWIQRMSWHELVGMFPSRQRLHAVEPLADRGMRARDVEPELFGRIIEIPGERDVPDG